MNMKTISPIRMNGELPNMEQTTPLPEFYLPVPEIKELQTIRLRGAWGNIGDRWPDVNDEARFSLDPESLRPYDPMKAIGLPRLPMMMNPRHIRLNYYSEKAFEHYFGKLGHNEHAHNLKDELAKIPKVMETPLAIVGNFSKNAKPNSLVVITTMDLGGKKIVGRRNCSSKR